MSPCALARGLLETDGVQPVAEIDDEAIQQLGLTEQQYTIFEEMQMNKFSIMIHCRRSV